MWSLLTPALGTAWGGGEQAEELKVFLLYGKFWLKQNKSPQKLFLNYLAFFSWNAKLDFAFKNSLFRRIGFEMQNLTRFNIGFQSSENTEVFKPKVLNLLISNELGNSHQRKLLQTLSENMALYLKAYYVQISVSSIFSSGLVTVRWDSWGQIHGQQCLACIKEEFLRLLGIWRHKLEWKYLADVFTCASLSTFCFPQQIKAVERYMRRLEFHISKVTSTPSMSYIRKNNSWT